MLLDAFFIEDKISLTLIGLEEKEDWTLLEWETEINETMLIIEKMTGQVSELRASKIGAPKNTRGLVEVIISIVVHEVVFQLHPHLWFGHLSPLSVIEPETLSNT